MESKVAGACLCGTVRFEVGLPMLFCAHCHCTMCQRSHGAGYVTWIGVPYERFAVIAGSDRLVRYQSSTHGTRTFCGACGSSLFCESTNHPAWIDIVLANLSAPADVVPQAHYYFDDRAPWVEVADRLPRFGGKTGTEPL